MEESLNYVWHILLKEWKHYGKMAINMVRSFQRHSSHEPHHLGYLPDAVAYLTLSIPGLWWKLWCVYVYWELGGEHRESGSSLGPWTSNREWHLVCAEWVSAECIYDAQDWGPETQLCLGAFKDDMVLLRTRSNTHLAGRERSLGPKAHWEICFKSQRTTKEDP